MSWIKISDEELLKAEPITGFLCVGPAHMNYKCSSCGFIIHNDTRGIVDHRSKYCPNCGLKQDDHIVELNGSRT